MNEDSNSDSKLDSGVGSSVAPEEKSFAMTFSTDAEVQGRLQELAKHFPEKMSWENKYRTIIDWAKELPSLADEDKKEDFKVKGCQSQVWLLPKFENGRVIFRGDSDALIVKGLVHLLLKAYSDLAPEQILGLQPDFLKKLGFESHLSPSRANGLFAMVKQIQYYALAYKALATPR